MSMQIIEEGKKAFKKGIDLEFCPYEVDTAEYYEWEEGWVEASEEYEDD